jgi:hypothetical protein
MDAEAEAASSRDGSEIKESSLTPDTTDNYSVWWTEPEDRDPDNPLNWSNAQKWSIIGVLSLLTFLTYVSPGLVDRFC